MEFLCMEARALKPSLRRELSMKQTQQALFDDVLCFTPTNGVVSNEDFSVDCFFDFGEFKDNYNIQEQASTEGEEEEEDSLSCSSQDRTDDDSNSNSSCFPQSFLASELSVPVDDWADLEWVSNFVDDSLSELPLLYPPRTEEKSQILPKNLVEPRQTEPVLAKTIISSVFLFPTRVPAKPRTKRARTSSGSAWLVRSPLTESSSSSSSASSPIFTNLVQPDELLHGLSEPEIKRQKKKSAVQTGEGSTQFLRRCSHCHVNKTPQWRTGPLGAKTLCNACGVRYKSGRLFPEYRPACSPTFSIDVHSNSHRKVLEMRKRKEMVGPEQVLNQMVQSF